MTSNTAELMPAQTEVIYLPLAPNYVSHWGFWEAFRELAQNALDTDHHRISSVPSADGIMQIHSRGDTLTREHLLLGNSSKSDDPTKVGEYGEGLKLAMLVLTRAGHGVTVLTQNEIWEAQFEIHPQLNSECLAVHITPQPVPRIDPVVEVFISNCDAEHAEIISDKILSDGQGCEVIAEYNGSQCLKGPSAWGGTRKLFVKGLFVCDLGEHRDFEYSYNFAPDVMNLDRDRDRVDDWDLAYEATRLLTMAGKTEILADLARRKRKDVSDCFKSVSSAAYQRIKVDLSAHAIADFQRDHGMNAYPINDHWSIGKQKLYRDRAIEAGLKPVVVPSTLYGMFDETFFDRLLEKIPELCWSDRVYDQLDQILLECKKHMRSKPFKRLCKLRDQAMMKGV